MTSHFENGPIERERERNDITLWKWINRERERQTEMPSHFKNGPVERERESEKMLGFSSFQ